MASEIEEKTIYHVTLKNQGGDWEDADLPHFIVIAEDEETVRKLVRATRTGRREWPATAVVLLLLEHYNQIKNIKPIATGLTNIPNGITYITSSLG